MCIALLLNFMQCGCERSLSSSLLCHFYVFVIVTFSNEKSFVFHLMIVIYHILYWSLQILWIKPASRIKRTKSLTIFQMFYNVSVSKIVRVIRQPRGNMLLVGIGGSGRQSLTRLAANICEYTTFQIEVTKHYRKQEFRDGEDAYLLLIFIMKPKLHSFDLANENI